MSSIKTLLLDCDGVLADFTKAMMPFLGFDGEISPKTWQWRDLDISEERFDEAWSRFLSVENAWAGLEPLSGLWELETAINNGLENAVDIVFLTSRGRSKGYSPGKQTALWLNRHLPALKHPTVIAVETAAYKLDVARAVKSPALLDDHGPTVVMARRMAESFLLRRSWNEHDEKAYAIPSVGSVKEFLELCGFGEFNKENKQG
jgi:hypothetical protein